MNKTKFKKLVGEIVPLILSYGADFYKLESFEDSKATLKKVGKETFLNKCHEGFKLAQPLIVTSLLEIEREKTDLLEKLNQRKQFNHLNHIKADKAIDELNRKIDNLEFQKSVFNELANTMAWYLLKFDRTKVKAHMQSDMWAKSLAFGNIKSLIETADYYNKDADNFALITDITSCLGHGDLLLYQGKKGSLSIVEVKEGKVNDQIINILHKKDFKSAKEYLLKLSSNEDRKNFLKQLKRVLNQQKKSFEVLEYIKKGFGVDHVLNKPKQVIESNIVEDHFIDKVYENLKSLYTQKEKDSLYFPFSCGLIALVNRPTLSDIWDFKHFIYHLINGDFADCPYKVNKYKEKMIIKHLPQYIDIPLFNMKNKVYFPTHMPLFFVLGNKYSCDLITEKLGIFSYFHADAFYELCEIKGLNPEWVDYKKHTQNMEKYIRANIPDLNGKCLVYGDKNHKVDFSNGYLFRIIYEFVTPECVTDMMVNQVEFLRKCKK